MNAAHLTGLERLEAIEDIRQLKARYFRAIDQKLWNELHDVFAVDATIDTSNDAGERGHHNGSAGFIENVSSILAEATTAHYGHMSEITVVDADNATGIWSMEDTIWWPEATGIGILRGTGWYEERYQRIDGAWRIVHMRLRRQRVEIGGVQTFPPPTPEA